MSRLALENVHVQYPAIRDSHKLLKRAILRTVTGGKIYAQDAGVAMVHALKDLSFEARDGDRIGLIGRNGAGKSTLLKTMAGIITPSEGMIHVDGRITSFYNVNGGMDIEQTGYDNIFLLGRLLGIRRKQMQANVSKVEEFSELGEFLSQPVRAYSDGMKVRLATAILTCLNPDILLMDEAITAGDEKFIEKTVRHKLSMFNRANILVLASHSPFVLQNLCTKAIWLEKGEIVQFGEVNAVLEAYQNAY